MRLLRRVVFWLFVAIYLTVCPLTILYAFGYLYEPGAAGGLVKTGLIYLSTAPPGASVYLGNGRYTQPTPTILRDLLPGTYQVKLVLKGHRPWSQAVPVEAEKASVLEHVLLMPSTMPHTHLVPGPFEQLIPLPASDLGLLLSGDSLSGVTVYDWKHAKRWPLLPRNSPWHGARLRSHVVSHGSSDLFLRVETREGEHSLWVELKPEVNRVEDLTRLLPKTPHAVVWDSTEGRSLCALHDGGVQCVDTVSKTPMPRIAQPVLGVGTFEKSLYLLREDGTIERRDLEGRPVEDVPPAPRMPRTLLGARAATQLLALSLETLLLWGERGELLMNRFPYFVVPKGVLGLEADPQREHVLVWTKTALGYLDVSDGTGEDLSDEGPVVHWFFTRGNHIEQAFWVYEGSHVVVRDGAHVFLLELETYGKPHRYDLLDVKPRTAVAYAESTGQLYFLEAASGSLSSIELLPKQELILLPFPQRREERAQRIPEEP